MKNIHFWCTRCRKDFGLPSFQRFVNTVIGMAWTAPCPDCNKCLYRLRDVMAGEDPYFRLSKYMRAQVMKHRDHLVQFGDPRFDLLYPEHAKKLAREQDIEERKTFDDIQKKYG